MKKSFMTIGLLALITGMSAQASCLELYKERNNAPSDSAIRTGVALSSTGVTVAYGGAELASSTYAAAAAVLADNDNIIIDLIALDYMQDAISSATEAVFYGSSSTLAATGVIDDSRRNFKGQIELIQEAQLSPKVTGTTLAEFTEDINDIRSTGNKVTTAQVAEEIRVADARGEFCVDADNMMSMTEIREYINDQF